VRLRQRPGGDSEGELIMPEGTEASRLSMVLAESVLLDRVLSTPRLMDLI
jgi:hypothetical protein